MLSFEFSLLLSAILKLDFLKSPARSGSARPPRGMKLGNTHPTHDVNDMWRMATPPGSTSPTLFEQQCGLILLCPTRTDKCNCCETGRTVLYPYRRRKTNCLQMSLQRQHFLLSYLKTLRACLAGVRTCDLPLSRVWHSPNWANQVAVLSG